jgi:hypothetical protein
MARFDLHAFLTDPADLVILSDWLDFCGAAPGRLLLTPVGDAASLPALAGSATGFAKAAGLLLTLLPPVTPDALQAGEIPALSAALGASDAPHILVARMDNLPWRRGDDDWLANALDAMAVAGAPFLTGGTLAYRADRPGAGADWRLTQRVYSSVLLADRAWWLRTIAARAARPHGYGAFAGEGLLEDELAQTATWGLRRLNTPDWRVFHTQGDGATRLALRDRFRAGERIGDYLTGFQDDIRHPWQEYYLYPPPSALKRARIWLGERRRGLRPGPSCAGRPSP